MSENENFLAELRQKGDNFLSEVAGAINAYEAAMGEIASRTVEQRKADPQFFAVLLDLEVDRVDRSLKAMVF